MKKTYHTCCVNSTADLIHSMTDQAEDISRLSFLRYVDSASMKQIEAELGYDKHFKMDKDWHVSYHKSVYDGKPCVYFCHSLIEYIFV